MTERQIEIYSMHTDGIKQVEIAKRLGLSKQAVSKALKVIKSPSIKKLKYNQDDWLQFRIDHCTKKKFIEYCKLKRIKPSRFLKTYILECLNKLTT